MDKAAVVFLYLSGISYIAVGAFLLHKASQTRGLPERYLGLAFLFNGISYGFSEIPFVFGVETLIGELTFVARIWAGACALAVASFTYRVFRPSATWARWLVGINAALIVTALGVSALEGDWGGMAPLSYKGYWIEWVACIVPFTWLSVESFNLYSVSQKRLRIGLIDPLICNRYFLIGLYGALASTTYFLVTIMYIRYELHGTWSAPMDLSLGILELVSVITLSISFRAPAFYRRWVGAMEAHAA